MVTLDVPQIGDFLNNNNNSTTQSGSAPSLDGMSRVRNGKRYRLQVVQHPERARMCGFGDKDRRPLSPSLIVKLIVFDEQTNEIISPWNVNTSLFFLAADLCHPDDLMLAPRNLLVHQHAASIPATVYAQSALSSNAATVAAANSSPARAVGYPGDNIYEPSAMSHKPPPPPPLLQQQNADSLPSSASYHHPSQASNPYGQAEASGSAHPSTARESAHSQQATMVTVEHYTRNLVGAAVTSANVLRDERDEFCIFFVLQDLSVRTEGIYRIRLVFTDLAQQDGDTNVNVSEALAEAYTEPFTVYSPRRFPGMLEPTELSKKLAAQGIKIAVRSDKKKRRRQSVGADGPGGRSVANTAGGSAGVTATSADYEGEMDELDEEDD